jgi:hypothetical protein
MYYVLYSTLLNIIKSEKLAYLNHINCLHKDVGFITTIIMLLKHYVPLTIQLYILPNHL